jgi:hypothetical protein
MCLFFQNLHALIVIFANMPEGIIGMMGSEAIIAIVFGIATLVATFVAAFVSPSYRHYDPTSISIRTMESGLSGSSYEKDTAMVSRLTGLVDRAPFQPPPVQPARSLRPQAMPIAYLPPILSPYPSMGSADLDQPLRWSVDTATSCEHSSLEACINTSDKTSSYPSIEGRAIRSSG